MNVDLDDRRAGLQPPRFGLGTLLAGVSLCAVIFAVTHYVGMLGAAILILFVLGVMAHVAGNAIGTRLRQIGSEPPIGAKTATTSRQGLALSRNDFAPVSRLRQRDSLGKRNLAITVLGAMVGGICGGLALVWLPENRTPLGVLALGSFASAILAGIWTFAAASFVQVMLGAWFHASREPRKR